jgi:hypothetical protein
MFFSSIFMSACHQAFPNPPVCFRLWPDTVSFAHTFMTWNFCTSEFCAAHLLADNPLLSFSTPQKIVFTFTVSPFEMSDVRFTSYVIRLCVLHQLSSVFMCLAMWEHCTRNNWIISCTRVYYAKPSIITGFVLIPVSGCWFGNICIKIS